MPCSPSELISIAEQLSNETDEASHRASISRAYYGAYHHANNYLASEYNESDGFIGGDGGVHKKLITFLETSIVPVERSAGYIMNQIKRQRVGADYCLDTHIHKDVALATLRQAQAIIEKLEIKTE